MSKVEVNQISSQCGSTLTIGQSGDTVTLAAGATQSGFGRTGTVDWDTTAKTASFTAVSGNGYFVNTTSGAVTVTLPATPSAGDIVAVADYASTSNTNNITIARNGSNINGSASDITITIDGKSITLVYIDGTQGWKIINNADQTTVGPAYVTATGGTTSTCGDYRYHVFTSPGTFCVSCAGNTSGSNTIQTLIVAGGGGGGFGASCYGGGGGAGGVRNLSCISLTVQGYPITVGGGGTAGTSVGPTPSGNGSNSSAISNTSAGGGRGGSSHGPSPGSSHSACAGGSGGGAAGRPGYAAIGAGNTPPVTPPQGNDGGGGGGSTSGGGGGGGAACAGTDYRPTAGASFGGDGINLITCFPGPLGGSPGGVYGGGGGGTAGPGTPQPAAGSVPGGTGGGGQGSFYPAYKDTATAGTANTGGGGGGGVTDVPGPESKGGAGGSGIVIIKYKYQN